MKISQLTWSNTFSGELSSWYDELDARLMSILGVRGACKVVVVVATHSCDCCDMDMDDGLCLVCGKTPAGPPFDSIA